MNEDDLERDNLAALLKWQLETPNLDRIRKTAIQAQEIGDYDHSALKIVLSAPRLKGYEEAFWEAYGELCTCRPPTMGGLAPIPFPAILQYAQFWGYSRSETEALWKAMRELDQIHCEHINSKLAEKQ